MSTHSIASTRPFTLKVSPMQKVNCIDAVILQTQDAEVFSFLIFYAKNYSERFSEAFEIRDLL